MLPDLNSFPFENACQRIRSKEGAATLVWGVRLLEGRSQKGRGHYLRER